MDGASGDEIAHQLAALGVRSGGVLLVHTAFRQVRPVAGGPLGLIRALRKAVGPAGTLVMPTMTDGESLFDPASKVAVHHLTEDPLVFLCAPNDECDECRKARSAATMER